MLDARLLELAREQLATIADLEVREVWSVLCSEIEVGNLPAEGWFSIDAILVELERGSGRGVNELYVGTDDEGDPERVVVSSGFIMPRRLSCSRDRLVTELRSFLGAHRSAAPNIPTG